MPKTTTTTDLRDYALVAERIAMFYAAFPSGQIVTEILSRDERETVVRASVYRTPAEARPSATGLAAEREGDGDINAVACLENTETSAVGRALANLGFLASRKRPSLEEMQKAARARSRITTATHTSGADSGSTKRSHHSIRKEPPLRLPVDDVLQAQADALADCLRLLDHAVRSGMPEVAAAGIRGKLVQARSIAPSEIARIEHRLRDWIRKRDSSPAITEMEPVASDGPVIL